MKKDFAKVYSYTRTYMYRLFDSGVDCECSCLKAHRNNRLYSTKMEYNSLPEYYCDVNRYGMVHNVIDSKGVLNLKYNWFKMNHFMRDSSLEVSFMDSNAVSAVLYVWQGGQEGGNSVADVIVGNVSPSGKLTDTIAYNISDYPSDANFGDPDRDFYAEDIYVGYRYFETFAKDRVLYPFGFGLSYTDFSFENIDFSVNGDKNSVSFDVKNVGEYAGKEVAVIIDESQPFTAKVVKQKNANHKGTQYGVATGTRSLKVIHDGKTIYQKKIFLSTQEVNIYTRKDVQ